VQDDAPSVEVFSEGLIERFKNDVMSRVARFC